jgi:uncharacterized Tic20 family protein
MGKNRGDLSMSLAEEIEKLNKLKKSGTLSEDEYQKAKQSVLDDYRSTGEKFNTAVGNFSSNINLWSMFIHLSQFFGYIVPLAGWVVPVVLWQVKKNDSEIIDKHGRIVTNWIISAIIYASVFSLLCFIVIGIPLLFALSVVGIVFPIIGGIKANNGETWRYPLSIIFFKIG